MSHVLRNWGLLERRLVIALAGLALAVAHSGCSDDSDNGPSATRFETAALVSDIEGAAPVHDPLLVNPWGLALSSSGPFWVANNGTGTSTLYNGAGEPFPIGSPLIVSVPGAPGGSSPTGIVFNGTTDFVVSNGTNSGAAAFIFDTEDGTISGWNPTVDPMHALVTSEDEEAIYKGLAIGSNSSGNFIYATNFAEGKVEPYDGDFEEATLPGSFTDPNIPAGFAPFGIQNIGGELYVTYAKQDAEHEDDVAGPGNGYVDVFDTNGNFKRRLISQGELNSPWGLVIAPESFGTFAGDLLVGNFGDGRINAYDPQSGTFLGTLTDEEGDEIVIPGLWALVAGNDGNGGDSDDLYFTAGPSNEQHGIFGELEAVSDEG